MATVEVEWIKLRLVVERKRNPNMSKCPKIILNVNNFTVSLHFTVKFLSNLTKVIVNQQLGGEFFCVS